MSGICGLLQRDGTPLPPEAGLWLAGMNARLAHRGPDAAAAWRDGPVALGWTGWHGEGRFLAESTQDHPANRIPVVWDGQLYNLEELRAGLENKGYLFRLSTEAEVVPAAWECYGTGCLEHMDGVFAFALWDRKKNILFCARDCFGEKPFVYTAQRGYFAFGSELFAIKSLPEFRHTVHLQSVMRYLAYEHVPGPASIHQETYKLPPAHFLLLENGRLTLTRYWSLPAPEPTRFTENDLAAALREKLARAVRRRLPQGAAPVACVLSGGLDSSAVTALTASMASSVATFSVGFAEDGYDESAYARLVARHYATEHHEIVLRPEDCAAILPDLVAQLDEPMADASIVPTWLVRGLARKHAAVALGGDGADELHAGYEHFLAFAAGTWYGRLPAFLRRRMLEPLAALLPDAAGYINLRRVSQTFLQGAYAPEHYRVQRLHTALSPEVQRSLWREPDADFLIPDIFFAPTSAAYGRRPKAGPLERVFSVYAEQLLPDSQLCKVDRCSVPHGLHAQTPFLDREFAEFSARLPVHLKLRGLTGKYLLKKACSGLVPALILKRPKRGFQIPVAAWLRGPLKPLLEETLHERVLREQGFFHPPSVRRLLDEHGAGKADHRNALWTLLILQLWLNNA